MGRTIVSKVDVLRAENERLRSVLAEIHLLALEANEEYESSCRAKVNRIYGLSSERAASE